MIVQEKIMIDSRTRDGDYLIRTYSDAEKYIQRDGVLYCDAIDLPQFNYEYTETDIPLPTEKTETQC